MGAAAALRLPAASSTHHTVAECGGEGLAYQLGQVRASVLLRPADQGRVQGGQAGAGRGVGAERRLRALGLGAEGVHDGLLQRDVAVQVPCAQGGRGDHQPQPGQQKVAVAVPLGVVLAPARQGGRGLDQRAADAADQRLPRRRRGDPLGDRTPRFDLDCLYGRGPADQPYLYDAERPGRFLIGRHDDELDLPRNEQQTALIGDPRNDENIIVSQLQLTMLLFHNSVLDRIEELRAAEPVPEPDDFTLAQRIVRWHYQWVVVHDFLRRIVGEETLNAVLRREPRVPGGRRVEKAVPAFFHWRRAPFIPVEFSGAAYRFGHSLVRARYKFNTTVPALPIFTPEPISQSDPLSHLGGFRILPPVWQIEWPRFFPLEEGRAPVPVRAVDTRIVPPLLELPPEAAAGVASLVERNLTRGVQLGLPSGQAVAGAMGLEPLSHADLGLPRRGGAPLWYYVLREAEVLAGGRHLGPVGGRIVAEVFLGLLAADPSSYLSTDPGWTPTLPSARPGEFTMSDLIRFTGFGLAEV